MAARRQAWNRERIKGELRTKFGPITELSIKWGYARGAISAVLMRRAYSIPLEIRIAAALEVSPHALWPDRWTPDGQSLPRFSSTDTSRG